MSHLRKLTRRRILTALAGVLPGCGSWGKPAVRNVAYSAHQETVLDVWLPRSKQAVLPAMIVIHGGGWREDSKAVMDPMCLFYLRGGFAAINVEYRLAPRYCAPAAVEDVLAATAWVWRNAASYGIDRDRIAATGVSAGSHLALMSAFSPEAGTSVRAVVNLYGPTDLVAMLENGPEANSAAAIWIPPQRGRTQVARSMSPLYCVRAGLPPVLTLHKDADPLVRFQQAERLTDALRAAGNRAELIHVPGQGHSISREQLRGFGPHIFAFLEEALHSPQSWLRASGRAHSSMRWF